PADYLNPRYAELHEAITALIKAEEPHHATRVLAHLRGTGQLAGHHGRLLTDSLQTVTLLGTPAVGVRTLAADVLDASYRRRFATAAAALTRASTEAPTDDLFELMLEQGRAMRAETNRRDALGNGSLSDCPATTHQTKTYWRNTMRAIGALIGLGAAAALIGAGGYSLSADEDPAPAAAGSELCDLGSCEHGAVDRVIDGDTVDVVMRGDTRRVRVLGIDTPETNKPGEAVECF